MPWNFDNTYSRLPNAFFEHAEPSPVRQPKLAVFNDALALDLGLEPERFRTTEGVDELAGNRNPTGSTPIAQAYAGHQFGHFTMLGDGRAIVLGEHTDPAGRRWDVQLKGSGQTPYSRRGDGKAALGPMLREYIISEAMHALGIPTTRSLAVVATGENVYRETPLPGAVLTRIAASHLRVGTFQYAAARQELDGLKSLADYTIQRHFPEWTGSDNPYTDLIEQVMTRQIHLIVHWMKVGFIHGVMNTDNMSVCGEMIDYGFCAFMDAYDPATVFSSIDRHGRYAFGNQPTIALWNLARFSETLLPLIHRDAKRAIEMAEDVLSRFAPAFQDEWERILRHKCGLFGKEENDKALVDELLAGMKSSKVDYINGFRQLMKALDTADEFCEGHPSLHDWWLRWRDRRTRQTQSTQETLALMQSVTPAVIPRNYHVEAALFAATEQQDYSPMQHLLQALRDPYNHAVERSPYQNPPPADASPYCTFCGT